MVWRLNYSCFVISEKGKQLTLSMKCIFSAECIGKLNSTEKKEIYICFLTNTKLNMDKLYIQCGVSVTELNII